MFEHPRTPVEFFAATLTGAALFFFAPVAAQDNHGIIALGVTDQGNGVAYGFAWYFPAKNPAADSAPTIVFGRGFWGIPYSAVFQKRNVRS